jgi:branched-chain amino acid transport system substrate-binding protein
MRHRRAWIAALAAIVAASACGSDEPPLRIGVVVDCIGIARSLQNAELSGAQLPLIERGAHRARDGVTEVEVAQRPVELVTGCTEAFGFATLTSEVRRLAQVERVDAVIAAGTGPDEVVLRDVARTYPDVVFLPVVRGPREVTLHRTAPNLFRFAGDYGQGVAGLAAYAYRRLGWRRAAVVLGAWDGGWLSRDAFLAEFCALGGTIVEQIALTSFDQSGRDVRKVPRDVDGVAVFAGQFFGPAGFIRRLAARWDDPARALVVGSVVVDEPALLRATAPALAGVAASSAVDPLRMRNYVEQYERAFPGASTDIARTELVTGYRDAMEALLQAFERADGSTDRLPSELARLRVDLLGGPVRLDSHRQAVVSTSLVRIDAQGGLTPIERRDGVDQSLGGLLPDSLSPSDQPASCRSSDR